jgi:hypothetical protein
VTGRLRALKAPAAVDVGADAAGAPVAVRRPDWPRPRGVRRVHDRWRVVDGWWRERSVERLYHLVLVDDAWFEQRD